MSLSKPGANRLELFDSSESSSNRNTGSSKLGVITNYNNDDFYNMNFKHRGLALIFNHDKFEIPDLVSRPESKYDRDALRDCLLDLGFVVHVHENLRVTEIEEILEKVAFEVDHSNNDCLLVAIMTHGRCEILTALDGEYQFENVWKNFTGHKCPTLAGKPKIFITQACQGSEAQDAVQMERIEHDGGKLKYSIPTHVDFLFVHSTIPNYCSFLRENFGSWFIQSLCTELNSNGKTYDFLTLLTFVIRRVAIEYASYHTEKKYYLKKQTPCFVSLLTRLLKFTDKQQPAIQH